MVDTSNELEVACRIQSPTGWLNLQDPSGGYELEVSTVGERAVAHRKVEASSGWMEGSYYTRTVRENVTETLAVYVFGSSAADYDAKEKALTDAFDQLSFQVIMSVGNSQKIWDCWVSDYTITTSRDHRFYKMGLVNAQVPRMPTVKTRTITPGSLDYWVLGDPELSELGVTTRLL